MSRSGYSDEYGCDNQWDLIMWRGAVASSIRGKRGQAFLRELIESLDAMPEKRLIAHELRQGGEVCAIGSVGARRGIDLESLDPEYPEQIAQAFGIATPLVREIEFMNDEGVWVKTPEERWTQMRAWAVQNLKKPDNGALAPLAEPTATGSEQ